MSISIFVWKLHNCQKPGFQMLADIRKDLVTEFKKEGIEIPYPHMHIVN